MQAMQKCFSSIFASMFGAKATVPRDVGDLDHSLMQRDLMERQEDLARKIFIKLHQIIMIGEDDEISSEEMDLFYKRLHSVKYLLVQLNSHFQQNNDGEVMIHCMRKILYAAQHSLRMFEPFPQMHLDMPDDVSAYASLKRVLYLKIECSDDANAWYGI